ncbi:hypothetical protein DKT77_09235 [Meridianimarinicoccus roseus]|uniref:Methyltransferase type 11 domain-containing protein n=1 Tax=Meridianimarinicoccus roseus TaxID=2072018 RepID=A0A2V2LHV2_9RHOB|nr:hypothetical protein DKT77_09235 [Meridianimarinicoccus roseus]
MSRRPIFWPEILADLGDTARDRSLQDRIETVTANIAELPFGDGAFDTIWSEGAVCNIGLVRGVAEWPRLPRPGGDLAQSELTRLTRQPTALEKRRNAAYPRSGHRGRENRRDRGRGSCLAAMFPPLRTACRKTTAVRCRPASSGLPTATAAQARRAPSSRKSARNLSVAEGSTTRASPAVSGLTGCLRPGTPPG